MPDLRFDNRVAVITGGGRGLGRAHALLLASRGCKIVVNDPGVSMAGDATDEGPAEALAAEIRAMGGEAVASTDSVATPEGGKAIIQSALDAFDRIDILIHSAGNVRRGSLCELAYEDFTAVLDVHLKGAYHVVREAFPHMMAQNYGRIVLTSSINGLYGKSDNVTYSICKAGFMGLSNTAAIEGQNNNVKSNLIVPASATRTARPPARCTSPWAAASPGRGLPKTRGSTGPNGRWRTLRRRSRRSVPAERNLPSRLCPTASWSTSSMASA